MTKNTRFSPEVRQRAIRMVLESQDEYDSQWAAICSIAPKIGCTPETLRVWVRQHERDTGGGVIKVNFGFINGQKFTTRNAMPDGFTPVDFDITYDCGDTSKIKNSLQMRIDGTTGVVDQYNLVARRRSSDNAPDVGIRIENLGGGVANIPFQNGILPVDPSGHGTVNMRAWPVNLVGGELETGKFQGTATITVIVR
ncbi:TPA: fimbrial protein [Escherichia coli]|nr:fimbrial protein [Escherichia coli]